MSRRRRRIQDKWRMKEWYNIISPAYLGDKTIASVPSVSEEEMIGRTVETTLYDITGDFSQQNLKLSFQVVGLNGEDAKTVFKGHEYATDYLRSLVRRGSTRIDCIVNLTTKDGYKTRVSVVAFSVLRVKDSQINGVREVMRKILKEKAESLSYDQFIQEAVLGKIASDIYNEAKKIIPLRHVGVRKSKLISLPSEDAVKEAPHIEAEA